MNLSKSYEYFQPETISAYRINIIGCGSVGSTLAENLARTGVTNFTLWDFDTVEPHNVVNQMFKASDEGKLKVEALKDIILEINPDIENKIELHPDGWNGEPLSGFVFLCVDNIEIRKQIVDANKLNKDIVAMFDFRTSLESAQHFAADWADYKSIKSLRNSMEFSHEEAVADTPRSACGVILGVCPTVRIICAYGVANFMNFVRKGELKPLIIADAFGFDLTVA